ncbi:insulinase family protein [Actinosynnema sp. NPDC002837]
MTTAATLPNGITVVVAPDADEAIACVTTVHATGYRDDPPDLQGLVHLVEHLLCRGDTVQGATREDHVVVQAFALPEDLPEALEAHADRLRAPVVDEASVRAHASLIAEETAALRRHPDFGFPWLPGARAVLGVDPLGDPGALATADPARVRSFLHDHVRPDSTVVVVSGRVDSRHALALAEQHFRDLPARTPRRPARSTRSKRSARRPPLRVDEARGAALLWRVGGLSADPHRTWAVWSAARALVGGPRPVLLDLAADRGLPGRAVVSLGLVGTSWDAPSPTALCVGFLSPAPVAPPVLHDLLDTASLAVPRLVRDAAVVTAATEDLLLDELALTDDPFVRARRIGLQVLRGGDPTLALDPTRLTAATSPISVERSWREALDHPPTRLEVA